MKKYLIAIVSLIILLITVFAYKEYNRKVANLTFATADKVLIADSLVALYERDETYANKLFLGKIVGLSGTIIEIKNEADTMVNITVGNAAEMHHVSCSLNKSNISTAKIYAAGNSIFIKGICTGYLADVELNQCVIIPKK